MKNILLKALFTLCVLCFFNCSDDDNSSSNLDEEQIIDDDDDDTDDDTDSTGMIPCENGFAGLYFCNGIDLVARIPLSGMGASEGNDCWGWTDPETGKEYAL